MSGKAAKIVLTEMQKTENANDFLGDWSRTVPVPVFRGATSNEVARESTKCSNHRFFPVASPTRCILSQSQFRLRFHFKFLNRVRFVFDFINAITQRQSGLAKILPQIRSEQQDVRAVSGKCGDGDVIKVS